MKLISLALFLMLGVGPGWLHAEEKKDSAQTALQALIAKTPEEKAKVKAQIASYPLQTCFVSGDRLDEPVDTLYGERLLRFCCQGCVRSFNKNPSKFLPKLGPAENPPS